MRKLNELEKAIEKFAPNEKAFKDFRYSMMTQGGDITSPGCWTVMRWLAEAGYHWANPKYSNRAFSICLSWDTNWQTGHGETLTKALVAVLLALPTD